MFTVMTCLCLGAAGQVRYKYLKHEGESVNMSCTSTSSVDWRCDLKGPKILSTKDGKISVNDNYLIIKNLSATDTCVYRCFDSSEGSAKPIAEHNVTVEGNFSVVLLLDWMITMKMLMMMMMMMTMITQIKTERRR